MAQRHREIRVPAKQEKPALKPYIPLARTRVFALDAGIDNYFQLLPDEVLEGRVEDGGSAVTFDDRRPRLQGLAIRHSELGMLIGAIRQVYSGA
jgi:hypothetical protein